MRKVVYFIGSSHAKRLWRSSKRIFGNKYRLINFGIPGAKTQDIKFPEKVFEDPSITTVLQTIGNDCFSRKYLIRTKDRVIHLKKVETIPEEKLEEIFKNLKEILRRIPGKILFVDNPVRHLCCNLHKGAQKNIISYQASVNRKIKNYFSDLANLVVFDHRKILSLPWKKVKNTEFYKTLLPDSVHFQEKVYDSIMQNLEKHF
mgnify:CR=1 FL=1